MLKVCFLRIPVRYFVALFGVTLLAGFMKAADAGFDPALNGNVNATLIQVDGKIVVGGSFTSLQPTRSQTPYLALRLARFNRDGTVDESFGTAFNDEVMVIAQQPDGRLLVGGKFTQVQKSVDSPAVARSGLVRLEADGSVDLSFDPNPTGAPRSQAQVYAIAQQPDGKILIGGGFTSLQPQQTGQAIIRQRIARLNADGSIDPDFDPRANNLVLAFAIQADGKILVGGGFTTFHPSGQGETISRQRIARLNTDGTPDSEFNPRANNRVLALAIESNGTILMGGDFTTLHPVNEELPTTRSHFARVSPEGRNLDGDFNPRPNSAVNAILVQRDGMVLLGGAFSQFLSPDTGTAVSINYLARLDRRGAIDPTFAPGPGAAVNALALHDDGRIVVGGTFTRFFPPGASAGIIRHRIARVQPTGALDSTFATDVDGSVGALAIQPNGQLLVGGTFSTFAGVTRFNLARINTDGTLDAYYHPDLNGAPQLMVPLTDGRLLISGSFSAIDGVPRSGFARLNADGTVDTSYDPKPTGSILALYVQSDGSALAFGSFSYFYPNYATDGLARNYVARINADGSVQDDLGLSINGPINVVARQTDGKYVIGGSFTAIGSTTRNYLARLNADLTLDTSFNPDVGGAVNSIAIHPDGKISFAGSFTVIQQDDKQGDDDDGDETKDDDADRQYLARVNADGSLDLSFYPTPNTSPQTLLALDDGKLLVGGSFTFFKPGNVEPAAWHSRLARLNADGTVDDTFTLQANDLVSVTRRDSDGKIFVGGSFTSVYSAEQGSIATDNHLVRLLSNGSVDQTWVPKAATVPDTHVNAIALLPDGNMVVGGNFERLAGSSSLDLAAFTADGATLGTTMPGTDGEVRALLASPRTLSDTYRGNAFAWLQDNGNFRTEFSLTDAAQLSGQVNTILRHSDGTIIVGGYFQNRAGTTSRELARFLPNGQWDTSFNPAPDSTVSILAEQPDGKILVGGSFTAIGGVERGKIARLMPDGSIDNTFNPPAANNTVSSIVVQADGKIIIGGLFTAFEVDDGEKDDDDLDTETDDDTGRKYLARLNADGTLDNTYRPEPNGQVRTLLFRTDGKLMVGGDFSTFQPNGASSATSRSGFAVLNSDASIDDYAPDIGGAVHTIAYQPDGRMLIGGNFSIIQLDDHEGDDDDGDDSTDDDADRLHIIRLNADLTLDAAFKPTPNSTVKTMFVQSDGRIVIGGEFTALQPNDAERATVRNYVARLHIDGSLDTSFNPNANGVVNIVVKASDDSFLIGGAFTALQPGSPILVAGNFQILGNIEVGNLGRLNADGNVDTGFLPNPNAPVNGLALQSDGRLLVAGEFTRIASTERRRIARFQDDGSLDSLSVDINGAVTALAVEANDFILIGGEFSQVNGAPRSRLARLTAAGVLDAGFSPEVDGQVYAIATQGNGAVLIGGDFTRVAGQERRYIARLNADGSLDAGFNPVADGRVESIAVTASGDIWLGGRFARIGGQSRAAIARIHATGQVDEDITAGFNGAVHTIVLNEEGRPFVGGAFSAMDAQPRTLITRYDSQQTASQTLEVNGDRTTLTWLRSGSLPELATVTIAVSTDRSVWTTVGNASRERTRSAWTWAGATLAPADTLYYVRLRGVIATSRGATSGVVEQVWQFYNSQAAGVGYPASMPAAVVVSAVKAEANPASKPSDTAAVGSVSHGLVADRGAGDSDAESARTTHPLSITVFSTLTGPNVLHIDVELEKAIASRLTIASDATELTQSGSSSTADPLVSLGYRNGSPITGAVAVDGRIELSADLSTGQYTVSASDARRIGGDLALTLITQMANADRLSLYLPAETSPPVVSMRLSEPMRLQVQLSTTHGQPVRAPRIIAIEGSEVAGDLRASGGGFEMWEITLSAGSYVLSADTKMRVELTNAANR